MESGSVTLADATAAEISFTMPKGDVSIKAVFVEGGGQQEYADILPLLKDKDFKAYVTNRMTYPQMINDKNYVAWDLGTADGKLASAEAAKVTAIDLDGYDVTSLEDLQYFPNLEVLVISYQYGIEGGLDVFRKFPKLVTLLAKDLDTPEGSTIDLTGCPDLTTVNFEGGFLYNLDVSNCPSLNELNVEYTNIETLDVSASTLLTQLNAVSTAISKLDVSHCSALLVLELDDCRKLSDLKLPQNSRLRSLYVSDALFSELDLSTHPMLVTLSCGDCPNLTSLDLSKCPDMDLLWATCCKLTKLNLKGCSKLFEVYCQHNNLTELDASDLGFYIDDKTGELTNTYLLHCGQQVLPGQEVSLDQSDEVKYDKWDVVAQPMTLYLREAQMEYWKAAVKTLRSNYGVNVQVVQ